MSFPSHDPRDIPVLTEAIDSSPALASEENIRSAQSAIVAETMRVADVLLHQAVKDMEAVLFERVRDRLREQLPELVERILKEQLAAAAAHPGADG